MRRWRIRHSSFGQSFQSGGAKKIRHFVVRIFCFKVSCAHKTVPVGTPRGQPFAHDTFPTIPFCDCREAVPAGGLYARAGSPPPPVPGPGLGAASLQRGHDPVAACSRCRLARSRSSSDRALTAAFQAASVASATVTEPRAGAGRRLRHQLEGGPHRRRAHARLVPRPSYNPGGPGNFLSLLEEPRRSPSDSEFRTRTDSESWRLR